MEAWHLVARPQISLLKGQGHLPSALQGKGHLDSALLMRSLSIWQKPCAPARVVV